VHVNIPGGDCRQRATPGQSQQALKTPALISATVQFHGQPRSQSAQQSSTPLSKSALVSR
jgi:hypothetical protein